ncbi:zinc finger protein basonuclin-2 isoform X2 [Pimephales promelas]|uniref:zinc finger protein basonuclin-2 isoform X1 n=1 Tax=Pimephales promelas TaxID=90988 RepID=UPI001955E24D|nr:zinc finger protein basonuclin-2 isoform X1 [Pimephales promelas]XP_039508224.1 zinc finger protein basonuclin-2 isoform X2 [Pimephales promelas]
MGTWTHTLHLEADSDESLLKREERVASVKMKETGCSHSDCLCECFLPGRHHIRSCDRCDHGWVAHAVGKVCPALVCSGQVEIVQSDGVFDIASLILFGTQALPVRMKILLDRLFSVLTHTQVLNIIHTLGWTLRDYVRGYMLQDCMGKVLDRWVSMSLEDEVATLRQFLRFGETKPIVELMFEEVRPGADPSEERGHSQKPAFPRPLPLISAPLFPADPHPVPQTLSKQSVCEASNTEINTRKHTEPRLRDPSGTRERRHGSSAGKGRVSCDECAKTFYDKGTLKIHFNAVHLKIKHRCTISGCNMMFSSLRSRNRHSANPNPRLHAALEHVARRFRPVSMATTNTRMHAALDHVTRGPPPVSMATTNTRLLTTLDNVTRGRTPVSMATTDTVSTDHRPSVCEAHNISGGGGATGNRAANQNGRSHLIDMTPQKKPRKSSTPLKFKPAVCIETDDDHVTISPRRLVNSLSGNKHHTFNTRHYKQFPKTLYGYRSNVEEGNNQMTREFLRVDDERKERYRHLLKVKEEMCEPTCDCRGNRHSNL